MKIIYSKKIIIIVAIIFFILLFFVYYFKFDSTITTQDDSQKNFQKKLPDEEFISYDKRNWETYRDKEYNYSLQFPSGLNTFTTNDKSKPGDPDSSVSFSELGSGLMGVKIYKNTPLSNTAEWVEAETKRGQKVMTRQDVEKKILIDGIQAIVTYPVSVGPNGQEELFQYAKKTVFIKGGNLFEIWTNFIEENLDQKVWDNFKFVK